MTKMPKISFITTVGVNVGDEFIREGICSFLDEIYEQWTPYYINKHDLTTLHRKIYDEPEILKDKIIDADIVVQAGAPVYWKLGNSASYNVEWADELWFNRIFRFGPEKMILNIAAGACQPYPDFAKTFLADPACVDFAHRAANACRWTSVRDPLASQILYALNIEHEPLPCSAFHAARRLPVIAAHKALVGINLMPLGGHFKLREDVNEGAWLAIVKDILKEIRKQHSILFIAHDIPEQKFMDKLAENGEQVFHSLDYREYMKTYAQCSYVLANRVHGAVCAAGFGRPAIIVGNDSRLQIADFIGLPSLYVGTVSSEMLIELFQHAVSSRKNEEERLLALREESAARYRSALIQTLMANGSYSINHGAPKQPIGSHLPTIASTSDIESKNFIDFSNTMREFARRYGFNKFNAAELSWGMPWIWYNGLSGRDFSKVRMLYIGDILSPLPWFFNSIGADVVIAEAECDNIQNYVKLKASNGLTVALEKMISENIPFSDSSFDVVISFSVIEHQSDKHMAVEEVYRVLKPGGIFALLFDIYEPENAMTFPEWNGRALTMAEFEEVVCGHPGFVDQGKPTWSTENIPSFIEWHKKNTEYQNNVVGATVLRKKMVDDASLKRVLLPRFDTHGDIVLLKGFIDALLNRFLDAEVTLFVREGYDQLKPLFSDRLVWRTQPYNPWARYSNDELNGVIDALLPIASEQWDLVLFTTFNRTFLEDILASMLVTPLCIGLGKQPAHLKWQECAFTRLMLSAENLYDQIVPVEELTHETEKYQRLWEVLFDQNETITLPEILIPDELLHSADTILDGLGLKVDAYVACMPAGVQNVKIKKWPEERFADALIWIYSERGLRPLLIGHESEKVILERVQSLAEAQGVEVKLWLGKHGEMGVMAALLHKAAFYLGNDSAPMHVAVALKVPTVGVYGGGTWPRFTVKGHKSICVVATMPCFYCMWDCIFGDAPCLKLITLEDVKAAIDKVQSGCMPDDHIHYADLSVSCDLVEIIEKVSLKYRDFQNQLQQRQEVIDALTCSLEDSIASYSHVQEVLKEMRLSISWRITALFRRLLDILRKI